MVARVVPVVLAAAITGTGSAPLHAERSLTTGVEVRTDLRTHPVRVPVGYRTGDVALTLVLDPIVLFDGEHDGDLTAEWPLTERLALLTGWRMTSIALASGHQLYQSPFAGITVMLGSYAQWQARFGAELAVLIVKHGADLPTSWIGFDRAIADRIHPGMFVRVEYAFAL